MRYDERKLAYFLLYLAPALFCSNMLVARSTAEFIPPVALAFGRWGLAFLILLPFVGRALWRERRAVCREWADLLALGGLGMGVCGAFVYIAADTTTATNIGLIYGASPVAIVLLARAFWGERLGPRQGLGVLLSLGGVLAIISRGDAAVFANLAFTRGDIWITAAAFGWAVYSVLLRHRPSSLTPMTRFAAITLAGLAVLLPFTLWEGVAQGWPSWDGPTLLAVVFLALVPGLGAYLAYGRIQRTLGAGQTALLMYLIPLYNGIFAYLLLGEALENHTLLGAALILPGIYLATGRRGTS